MTLRLMTSDREKMLRSELYDATDAELVAMRKRARALWERVNAGGADRGALLRELLRTCGDGAAIEPPFHCDYGTNIHLGPGVFVNMNCTFLDPAAITIGAQTMIGPSVQIYTATHPIDAAERVRGPELAFAVTLGARVWIGGGAVICPGVTIGGDTTIGAGSVVTHNVPSRVVAAGNPCRVIREL
jgi:maltose O-acetyltransferase